jgi:hypothetical protein
MNLIFLKQIGLPIYLLIICNIASNGSIEDTDTSYNTNTRYNTNA